MHKTMQDTLERLTKSLAIFVGVSIISISGSALSNDDVAEDPSQLQDWDDWSKSSFSRSDSPLLWLDDETLNVEPIVPPEPAFLPKAVMPTDTVEFEPATRKETIIPEFSDPEYGEDGEYSTQPYEGLLPAVPVELLRSILGTDGRTQITNTTAYPWRTIARLRIKFPGSSSIWGCSASIIDNFHILTAGHCIHDGSNWAEWVEVYPGQDASYTPYHKAFGTYFRSYTGWTVDQSPNHDWAVVTLDRNIGIHTGWMGRQTASSSNAIYTGTKNVSGYPCDKPTGTHWYDADDAHSATEYRYFYYMDTFGCQSGSPVWRYDGSDRYILAVHAYGDGSGTPDITNGGTRLNQDKYDRIITWLNEDSPSPPTDKADLIDDGDAYSSFTPTMAYPGGSFSANSDVRNIGTLNASGFYVSYYASTNTIISTGDYLLGSVWVSGVSAFDWEDANWSGNLPANIPPGSYYIGWIIDSTNTNSEFDEGNNTAYKASPQLTVLQVGAPSSITASDGAHTDKVAVTWSAVSGATSYELYRCTTSSTGSCGSAIYAGSSTSRDDTAATPGVTYYYRAKACNGAGCSGFSTYDTGYRLAPPGAPSSIAASDGTHTDKVAVTWSAVSGATSYALYRCTTSSTGSCGSAIYSGSGTSHDDTGATSGVTYYYRAKACNSAGCGSFSSYDEGYRLAACPDDITLDNDVVSGVESYMAGSTITAGPNYVVATAAKLTLTAGLRIRLLSGFSVQGGGELNLIIDPTACTM